MHYLTRISALALTVAIATPAWAQNADQAPAPGQEDPIPENAIIVTGERVRGQVQTDVPPVVELDEADIAAYGADSLADLISQLAPQTGSASGRGSGRPVFLVNGRRVSSFREFRRYPPEAIVKVEVFPEEVALQYGYPADQRVVNFILKDNFASREVELEYGQPTAGGRSSGEAEYSQLSIKGADRLLLGAEFNTSSMLTEAERGIVQTADSVPTVAGDPDPAAYRSLASDSESFELETTWNTSFGEGARAPALSINANLDRSFTRSLSGLDTVLLTDPDGNSELRAIDTDPITRRTSSTTASLGSSFNAPVGDWNLDLTLDAARGWSTSKIDRRRDVTALVEAAEAGQLDIAGDLGFVPGSGFDEARSKTYTIDTLATLTGHPILLPSGEVNVTAKVGYKMNGIDSTDTRNDGPETSLNRRRTSGGINLGIPLASAREDFLAPLGELGLDLGAGIEHLSDFGTLTNWNAGLNWRPSESLSLQASYSVREAAPSLTQLGSPQIIDVNVPVFDFATGETVLANVVTGGNPDLLAETQRDIKLSASYDFDLFERSNFRVEYIRNRSDDVTESFPVLTPAIEAAFPDRVTRVGGQLVELDRRAVTFAERKSSRIGYGFNFFGKVGKAAPENEGGGQRGGFMARGGASGGQGRGGFNSERFQQIRAEFCKEGAEPDISKLPEQIQQRLRDENGQIDPARVAQMRERFCSADGAPDPERMAAMRQALCAGWNPDDPSASTPVDLAALPERVRERLTGPDGQIDEARLNELRSRVCAAPQDGANQGAARRGGSSGARGGGRRGGGDGQGRWSLSLYHTIELENSALIAPGVPELDLLDGDALSGSGVSRHNFIMEGGVFRKGIGLRLSGNYASGAQVDTLTFHDLATFDLRLFMNLEEQTWLTGETPGFFKGSRMSLRVKNLFDARQRVTDDSGIVPLGYQPDLVDPLGRVVSVEFRKVF